MRTTAITRLVVACLIVMGPAATKAALITFDQMEGVTGCGQTYWLGDGFFDGCGFDHLSWVHTVTFDEPVAQVNSAKVSINFWDDDPDWQCETLFGVELCIPWQPEGAAISVGSTSFLPSFTFDYDDLEFDISFDFEIEEIDSGWLSFDVPGFASLDEGGSVGVNVTGFSPLSLQDFKVNGAVLTIDYTPGTYNEVPEPSALALLLFGLILLVIAKRKSCMT